MEITNNDWNNYITQLSALSDEAGRQMREWVARHGLSDRNALIKFANALCVKYGEGTAELACQMYDAIGLLSGKKIMPAIPAEPATYGETAEAINGCLIKSPSGQLVDSTVSRMVKQTGSDTMLRNALRDGAMAAWVPSGDTCAFCLTLASKGWQYVSKKTLKNGHAEHIHGNCNCEYGVRFDTSTTISGYNPDEYKDIYKDAEGKTTDEKINYMRRALYQQNKERINAQHREAYAIRRDNEEG